MLFMLVYEVRNIHRLDEGNWFTSARLHNYTELDYASCQVTGSPQLG